MTISLKTQKVLDAYAADVGGKQAPEYIAVIDVVNSSKKLREALNHAVENNYIQHIKLDSTIGNIGQEASYNASQKTITLSGTSKPRKLVFCLAHEVQHANYSLNSEKHYSAIEKTIETIAQQPPTRDYTAVLHRAVEGDRKDEALAEIAGWNAYVEYQRNKNPSITKQELLNQNPYKEGFSYDGTQIDPQTNKRIQHLHKDIQLNTSNFSCLKDGFEIPTTPANVEALSKHYFDNSGDVLGKNQDLSYKEYYSAHFLNWIMYAENKHQNPSNSCKVGGTPDVYINMRDLDLDGQKIKAADMLTIAGCLRYTDNSNPQKPQSSQLNGVATNSVKNNPAVHNLNNRQPKSIEAEELSQTAAAEPKQSTPTGFFDRLVEAAQSGDTAALQPIGQAYLKTEEAQTWLKEAADKLAQEQEAQAQEQSQQQTNQEQQTQEQQAQEATQQNKAMRM